MPHCMLCGRPHIPLCLLTPLPEYDRKGKEIMTCTACYNKRCIGKWCEKHRCYHEMILGADSYEGCLYCLAEEKRAMR